MKTVVVQNQGNHAGRPGLVGDWEGIAHKVCKHGQLRWATTTNELRSMNHSTGIHQCGPKA